MKYLVLLLFLSGCSVIDYSKRVEGWPDLKEDLRVVSNEEMYDVCSKFGPMPLGCVQVWFKPPLCRIWITESGGYTEEHEKAHCRGYDHIGSTYMQNLIRKQNGISP